MKIKSKRHPDMQQTPPEFKYFVNVYPIEEQKTVEALQRGIISRKQFFDQLMDVNFSLMEHLK